MTPGASSNVLDWKAKVLATGPFHWVHIGVVGTTPHPAHESPNKQHEHVHKYGVATSYRWAGTTQVYIER